MTTAQLSQCFTAHSQRLLKFAASIAYRLGLSREMAEDACQECFIKFYNTFSNGNQTLIPDTLYGWLTVTVRNYLLNVKREQKHFAVSFDNENSYIPEPVEEADDPWQQLESKENIEKIRAGLSALDADRAQVVYLRIYRDFSTRETARILKIQEGTVKSRFARAVENLKSYVS